MVRLREPILYIYLYKIGVLLKKTNSRSKSIKRSGPSKCSDKSNPSLLWLTKHGGENPSIIRFFFLFYLFKPRRNSKPFSVIGFSFRSWLINLFDKPQPIDPSATAKPPPADDSRRRQRRRRKPKAPKKRAETWVQEETRTLISLRREIDSLFNTSKFNKHLWDQISSKMREKGFDRSPTMCTDKWRNLLKEFKKSKQQPSSDPKMSYYKEIEEILRDGSKTTHFNPLKFSDKANMNHEVTLTTGPPSFTVFGYREHYRKKNIGIVIGEESELNIMRKENQRKHRAKEKGKEFQKGKEKENQPPNLHVLAKAGIVIQWRHHTLETLSDLLTQKRARKCKPIFCKLENE